MDGAALVVAAVLAFAAWCLWPNQRKQAEHRAILRAHDARLAAYLAKLSAPRKRLRACRVNGRLVPSQPETNQ